MDSTVVWYRIQLRTRIPIVSPIFHASDVCGRSQTRGNAKGPTAQTAIMTKDVRKYHCSFFSAKRRRLEASRNSPQCLHFIASSWISSAQNGHFFIIISLGRTEKSTCLIVLAISFFVGSGLPPVIVPPSELLPLSPTGSILRESKSCNSIWIVFS